MVDTIQQPRSAARWWRYSKYTVEEGRLRPAPGAKLQTYDVWDRYLSAPREGQFPYESLIRLVRHLDPRAKPTYGATPEDHQQIAEWCGEYGLLGLLPERALMIALAPRWRWESDYETNRDWENEGDALVPVRKTYVRMSAGWNRMDATWWDYPRPQVALEPGFRVNKAPPRVHDPKQQEQLVPPAEVPNWPAPHVVMQRLDTTRMESQTLGEGLGRFFPTVPADEHENYSYPCPVSAEFWQLYSEPLSDFIEAALVIRQIVEGVNLLPRENSPEKRMPKRILESLGLLNHLAGSGRSLLGKDKEGRLREHRIAGSLIGWLALMILHNLDEGKAIRMCAAEDCDKTFTSSRATAEYCSRKCRLRVKQRRVRARQETARRRQRHK
jgi:hypothetical protein